MTSITSPRGHSPLHPSTSTDPTRPTRSAHSSATSRPGGLRRTALVATGFLACALPVVFTVNLTRMLLTGVLPEHRFHQLTGQGLLLFAFWLVPLVAMLRAGWSGRRPRTAAGYQHLTFVGAGLVSAAVSPGGGAAYLLGVVAVTGALVWAALPLRPHLRPGVQVDPVLLPIGLLGAALLVPYAVQQLGLQHGASGHHAQNPHFFDMAWLVLTAAALGVLAGLVPALRGLVGWLAACCLGAAAAGLVLGESASWMLPMLALGVVAAAGWWLTRRTDRVRTAA